MNQKWDFNLYCVDVLKYDFKGMKFDVVVANPPYKKLDLKIMPKVLDATKPDHLIMIHPGNYLLNKKPNMNSQSKKFKERLRGHLKSVKFVDGDKTFDDQIRLSLALVILHATKEKQSIVDVDWLGDKFQVQNIDDVTKFGSSWKQKIKPLYERLVQYACDGNNIFDHCLKDLPSSPSDYVIQLAAIRGHGSEINPANDYYTIVNKDSDHHYELKSDNLQKPTWVFETKSQCDNFIAFLKTKFTRFVYAIYKNSNNMRGELWLVPWLDFSKSWTDQDLREKFEIDDELWDYIDEFIPDYY